MIIVFYNLTQGVPEIFNGAEKLNNLFYQLSIDYVINFIFYITQVYIPELKKNKACINYNIKQIYHILKQFEIFLVNKNRLGLDNYSKLQITSVVEEAYRKSYELKQIFIELSLSDAKLICGGDDIFNLINKSTEEIEILAALFLFCKISKNFCAI